MPAFRPIVDTLDIDKIASSNPPNKGAELYKYAWNFTLYNLSTKTAIGFGVGAMSSLLLFRRTLWPVALATGVGLGMAISEANHTFWAVEQKLLQDAPLSDDLKHPPPVL